MNQLQEFELNELEEQQEEVKQRFEITDLDSLNWVFRKMAAIQSKIDEVKALAGAERKRIDEWERKECEAYESDLAFFEHKVREYHERVLTVDPKAKSIKTPYGVAKATTYKARPEKVDESALISYVESNKLPFLEKKVEKKILWNELKNKLHVVESNGQLVVVDENGEIVPGVQAKAAKTTFKVEVSK